MSKRLERFPEKRVELKEDSESLHKSKHNRRVEINKIEEESGGFKPQAFKSSRSSRFDSSTKSTEVQLPSAQPNQTNKTAETSNNPAVSQQEIQKSLMHPSYFEDAKVREKRWQRKMFDLLNAQPRGSVEEFMKFTAKIITERSSVASRSSVKEQEYLAHIYVRSDNLAAVIISDQEYTKRVAHTLLNKVLDEFSKAVPSSSWPTLPEGTANYNELPALLSKFQNPKEADALTKLQLDLDETKIILHNTIESVLQRGEKLDDLVAKSEDLGLQSKAFYKTAKKTNACCSYL